MTTRTDNTEPAPEESRHLSVFIDRDPAEVYAFASRPENLPRWAAGLAAGVIEEDGRWYAESPMGRVEVRFAPINEFGVLDHEVITSEGARTFNPMRVLGAAGGCEVGFTLRRAGRTDREVDDDAGLIRTDLDTLRRVVTRE